MEVKTTKEKILQQATKSKAIKESLKILFPDIFEDDKYFDLLELKKSSNLFTNEEAKRAGFECLTFIQVRNCGELKGKAFYLSNKYNWELKEDSAEDLCLIPTKK